MTLMQFVMCGYLSRNKKEFVKMCQERGLTVIRDDEECLAMRAIGETEQAETEE